ncbi:hypothetical protein SEA_CLEARASMUD_53 [Microbacterium phage ClearAsMud]|uniref:Uncharacterized protein n=1 Tax=Microbacterium phage ClearAsMud TaxID=2743404 RepID=A0A7G9A0X4_9CAUD|nr:hypothetical protein QDA07_gp53 [Microbacterium phage ClearAsMud]QNL30263.1 hypothetical protein SEA_CLEARASMUD_53 [Microbacterium phage ClearAsMud]
MAEQTALPEGFDVEDARTHALSLSIVGNLLNHTGAYLTAEPGTEAEREAEDELNEFVERITMLGPITTGKALLVFASLVTATGDQEQVQAWFTEQSDKVAPFLTPEERGE